jgi:Flp pilus assembly protein TadB
MNIIDSIKTSVITPIHPAGIPFIAIFFVFTVIVGWLWSPLYFVGLVLTVWCVYFFINQLEAMQNNEVLAFEDALDNDAIGLTTKEAQNQASNDA